MDNMKTTRRWQCLTAAGLGLVLGGAAGCQTWVPQAGLTLPTGRYLEHPPQYIPPSPDYGFTRELATQEAINARAPLVPPLPGQLPPPVPGGPPAPGVLPPPAGGPLPGPGAPGGPLPPPMP
jgi:hypothetical protein